MPLPLCPEDTGPLPLPDPSCPGATRLTLADTTLRSLGSMDAWGDSRLTSPLPEGLLPPEDPPEELPPGETAAALDPTREKAARLLAEQGCPLRHIYRHTPHPGRGVRGNDP